MLAIDRRLGDARTIHIVTTSRADGDLCIDGDAHELAERRRAIVDRPWVWLRQVHGSSVVVVGSDEDPVARAGAAADAVTTRRDDIALAVHGADCATIALWTDDGAIAAVHAGWRGLLDGVVEAAAATIAPHGEPIHAAVGPTIGPECYEFGVDDLAAMRDRFGDAVVGTTAAGDASLDVRAAFDVLVAELDLDLVARDPACTACDADHLWSHRARDDRGRSALVIWIER